MINIGPIQAAGGVRPISGARIEAIKPNGPTQTNMPVDRVEISPIAKMMNEVTSLPEVRAEKIAQVRAEIQAGTYITPEKLDVAVTRLLEGIQDSPR